jgi:hypothetical protein
MLDKNITWSGVFWLSNSTLDQQKSIIEMLISLSLDVQVGDKFLEIEINYPDDIQAGTKTLEILEFLDFLAITLGSVDGLIERIQLRDINLRKSRFEIVTNEVKEQKFAFARNTRRVAELIPTYNSDLYTYSGKWVIEPDQVDYSQLKPIIALSPVVFDGNNVTFSYSGRDTNRHYVTTLREIAKAIINAKGEVLCEIDVNEDHIILEFYTIKNGILLFQTGNWISD